MIKYTNSYNVYGGSFMYIEEYYKMSCHIAAETPPYFNEYFSNQLSNIELKSELQKNMEQWLEEAQTGMNDIELDINLQVFIWYILSTTEASEDSNPIENRSKFHALKRDRKRNLFKVVKEEYENKTLPRNPMFLKENTELYFSLMNNNPDLKQYKSQDEYRSKRFHEVEEWYQDTNSDICRFLFFNSISAKRKAKYLELDLGFRIYDQIINVYYGNPVDGFVTRTPKDSLSIPAFSLVSRESDLKFDISDTVLTVYDYYENGTGEVIKTIVNEIPGNYAEIIEKNEENEYVRQLILNQKLYPGIKLLDSIDNALLTAINSMFNLLDINKGQKTISLSTLCKIAYSDTRQKYYLQTIQHLNRLANYRVNYTQRGENDQIINTGIMSFFDIDFQISEADASQKYISINVSDKSDINALLSELSGYDLRNIKVSIQPSANLRKAWKNHMNIKILTTLYDKITQPRVKMLLMYLQNIRTDKYPSTKISLPLTTIADQLRISHMRKNKIRELLNSSLEVLKENQAVIKSFDISTKAITIEFFPITDQEKEYYQLTNENELKEIMQGN